MISNNGRLSDVEPTVTVPNGPRADAEPPRAEAEPPAVPDAPAIPEVPTERDLRGDIEAVVITAKNAVARTGQVSAHALARAVETSATALTRRATANAIAAPRPVPDVEALREALAARSNAPMLATATTAALVGRLARRFGPLRLVAKRTPMWLLAVALPAVYASVARGAEELTLVASHLVHRVHAAGLTPDPDLVHRAAVRVMARRPGDEAPRSGALVVRWFRRAARAALPFTAGVATADPHGIARAAAEVDPASLARP